jgi:hypothetical protein
VTGQGERVWARPVVGRFGMDATSSVKEDLLFCKKEAKNFRLSGDVHRSFVHRRGG